MQKLNRKLEYSLMALKHMSQKSCAELTTAKEVADCYHAPFDATARSMQLMAQKGWLKSVHGVNGGYQLVHDLQHMTLLDLLVLIEGPVQIAKCMQDGDPCESQQACNIKSPIQVLNARLLDFYRSLSIHDIFSEGVTL